MADVQINDFTEISLCIQKHPWQIQKWPNFCLRNVLNVKGRFIQWITLSSFILSMFLTFCLQTMIILQQQIMYLVHIIFTKTLHWLHTFQSLFPIINLHRVMNITRAPQSRAIYAQRKTCAKGDNSRAPEFNFMCATHLHMVVNNCKRFHWK